ncbi:hypothetical protein K501DRAFT_337346 [Backusella circina FSU 941]|nr:hypothetical protein K501DRAFT_337346 [Backusella circina FSU 941]
MGANIICLGTITGIQLLPALIAIYFIKQVIRMSLYLFIDIVMTIVALLGMQSRQILQSDQIGVLDEKMKQNLEHLLLIEKLVSKQTPKWPFNFKNGWPLSMREHEKILYDCDVVKEQVLSNQQASKDQLCKSTEREKHLEEEIQRYKDDYRRLEHSYNQQRSIHLEKQLETHNKQDELEGLIADLKLKHKQEMSMKERLENQLDDVLTQCDLKVRGYQQNIKEMQAIIDHNEELERFNSASQLNNERYYQLEVEIERLQNENTGYRNKLEREHNWSDGEESHINNNKIPMLASHHLKNEELNILTTKNSELEVELEQAIETIEFLRKQHQDDRETIKKLSDNNMIYLDQIKLLTEENKNLTFQQ